MAHVTDNDFKESESVRLVKNVVEASHKCKTYFLENEKTPYIDGHIGILQGGIYRLTVDVQIRTLPKDAYNEGAFNYKCETKIFNYVEFRVSSNPTALFVADKEMGKVFFKMLTHDYVESLHLENEKHKTITFESKDEIKCLSL